jgi:hypothetical protein
MIKHKYLAGTAGLVLFSAVLGGTAHAQPSVSVGVGVPLPAVEIRVESDFYEPLTPYGRWEVVGSYGRCWIPGHVEADWRPYSEGSWQLTDAGWYWVSTEPWGWATYHYGRWDLSPQFGWYWMPQTQWAPAWVSWHSGGGYVGWAPLYPPGVIVISPRAYVFVQEGHFTEPVRRATLVVNSVTLINKTVIKEAPAAATIEKAGGRKLQAVPVQEQRRKEEAAVVTRQRTPAAVGAKAVQTPARGGVEAPLKKVDAVPAHPQVEKPSADLRGGGAPGEPSKSVPSAPESKPERPAQPPERREQPAAGEKPAGGERGGGNPAGKDHEDKPGK